jgi:hypothetical protein
MVTAPARRKRKPRPRTPVMPVITDIADAPAVIAALRAEHGDRPTWCRTCQSWPSLHQNPHWPSDRALLLSQRWHLGRPVTAHCGDHGCGSGSLDITGVLYNRTAWTSEGRLQQQTIAVTNLDVAPTIWAATLLTAGVAITEPTSRKYTVHGPGRERRVPHDDALFAEIGITDARADVDIADQQMWFLYDRDRFRDQTAWAAGCEVLHAHDQSREKHLYFRAAEQARKAGKSTYEGIAAGCAALPEPLRSTVADAVDQALAAIGVTPPA